MPKKYFSKKIFLITCAFLLGTLLFLAYQANFPNEDVQKIDKTTNSSETQPSAAENPKKETITKAASISNLTMPILMYHHIRDYAKEDDPIGTNLSVSTKKFQDQLDLINQRGYTTITFEDIQKGNIPEKPIILTFDDGYKNFFENAYPELKKRNMKAVVYVITGFSEKNEYLSEQEIIQLSKENFEIGSHTISHPDLTKISPERSKKEIGDSKSYLEKIINKKIISLCYPSGKFSSELENLVKESGYQFAVTTVNKPTSFDNSFELERYRVNSDTSISKFIP